MPGTAIGPYTVVERIGAGGMGEVYLADDPRLGRRVALKSVVSTSTVSAEARANLLREARAAAKLNHPNIAAVYDVLEQSERLYIVMEYVEGETAAALVRRGRVTVEKAVEIGIQLMDAVADAHAHGILHRDLKPGNIMISPEGRVKVLDFGLATIGGPGGTAMGAESSDVRVVKGTMGYMAPEILLGREADHRADLYAAGVVLFELLTGRQPFEAANEPARAVLAMVKAPLPPDALSPEVPKSLSAVVMRLLADEPAERYATAVEARRDLVRVADELGESATGRVDVNVRAPSIRSGRRKLGPVGGVAIAALAAVGLWIAWGIGSRPDPAQAFGARDWVLIADFDNRTGEPLFEHTLRVTLETALQQSKYVNVFPRPQVVDALRRLRVRDPSEPPRVDESRALEIARRENVKVVLAGSALASGDAFQLSVRALETASGALLFLEKRQFTRKEELFDQVDSLALAVREKLGEAIAASSGGTQPLARVTTNSLEALQLYSRATDEFARGRLETSRDLLQAALKADPDFAMAHVRLGAVFSTLGQFDRTREHYERAYALRNAVTEREAYAIESKYHEVRDDYEKARDSWRVLTQLYPDDLNARLELGSALHETGEFEASVPELRHVLTLSPFHGSAHSRLVLVLARIGRSDEALSAHEAAVAKGVDNPFLMWGAGLARMARREDDLARGLFTRLGEAGSPYKSLGDIYLAQLDAYEGKIDAARGRLEAGLSLDVKEANVAYELVRRHLLGRVLLLQGDRRGAESQGQAILAREEHLQGLNLYQAGCLLVRGGSLTAGRQTLDRLEKMHSEMPTPFHRTLVNLLAGEIALGAGRLQEAAAAFAAAADGYPTAEAHQGLATVHTRRKDWTRAREEWKRVLALGGEILQTGFAADWPLAHLAQARVCRQAGDGDCSRNHYRTFIDLWQRGEPHTARRDAEAELAALERRR
jgi:tetratricopeptide (TPR) repeat protein/tRNA A-37 threonylcarbamoyl transferase component Bud32